MLGMWWRKRAGSMESLVKKVLALLFAVALTIIIATSPQIINELVDVEIAQPAAGWAIVLINMSWIAFLVTFVLPTSYFTAYAMLGRASRRYAENAAALATPLLTMIAGIAALYFLQSSPLIFAMAVALAGTSAAALILVIWNNELARVPALTLLSSADAGNPPKVSVIIPAYNEEEGIRGAVESVLDQTYPDMEVIIVDDGSTDGTAAIVSRLSETYPDKVRLIRHEKNLGKFEALNSGMRAARGEFIYHMDADSYLAPDNVERIVSVFEDWELGSVASMVVIYNDDKILTGLQQIEYLFEQLILRYGQSLGRNVIISPGAGSLFRKSSVEGIPVSDRTLTEDADYSFEVRKSGSKMGQEPDAISFTEAPKSLSAFTKQRVRWLYGVLQTISHHRWSLRDPWVLWAWLGYILTPLSMIILISMPTLGILLGQAYLAYFLPYSIMGFTIFAVSRAMPLAIYKSHGKSKLLLYLPLYMFYNTYLSIITLYCFLAWVTRRGVSVRYGGRMVHAK